MSWPKGKQSHRKGISMEMEYGIEKAVELQANLSEKASQRRWPDKHREQISKALKGRISPNRGEIFPQKTKEKMSEAHLKHKFDCQCIGCRTKRREYRPSEKTKLKMSKSRKKRIGNNAPCWRGGISFEPYSSKFNGQLKLYIRERDNFICQFCGGEENGRAFIPHHIDYDKKNCIRSNLILLCRSCNGKANFERDKWQFLFETLIEIRT